MAERRCSVCGEHKPLSAFGRYSKANPQPRRKCKRCSSRLRTEWVARNPEKQKATALRFSLKSIYKITPAEYERLLANQHGACAICKVPPTAKRRLDIDHDHQTGRVRGLLCTCCNRAIGLLREDATLFQAAMNYITHA
jgi:hypothetical protein